MNYNFDHLNIIKPDDWHVHLREGEMLKAVINSSTRINARCIVMPNLKIPITTSDLANKYKVKKMCILKNYLLDLYQQVHKEYILFLSFFSSIPRSELRNCSQ